METWIKKSVVIENREQHFGMMPVCGIWKIKISGKM